MSDDGLTWTFTLEAGVTFHDGKPMTAKDVVFSFQRLLDPAVGSPGAALLGFLDPTGINAVDDLTVTFNTDASSPTCRPCSPSSTAWSCRMARPRRS